MTSATEADPDTAHQAALDAMARRAAILAEQDGRRPRHSPDVAPPTAAPASEGANPEDWSWLPPGSAARQFKDPYVCVVSAVGETLVEGLDHAGEAIGKLRKEAQQLKLELAELKAQLAETRAKADTTDFVLQRLRLENRGDPGPQGPMGRDGRDGAQGPAGPRGNRGQKGWGIAAWEVDAANYRVTAALENGEMAPALNLRGLFEQFNHDTEADDADVAVEQLAVQRADLELRAERVRQGRPER